MTVGVVASSPSEQPSPGVAEFTRACPSCTRLIHPKATTCMQCWAKVVPEAA